MDEYYEGAFSGPQIDDKLGNSTRQDAIAIVSDNNTHAAITSGQYVYVKSHGTLAEGLYQATTNISANGTLTTSNVTAVPNGGLNALKSAFYVDKRTVNYTGLNAGINYVSIPNVPSGYKPIMALGYNTQNDTSYAICGVRFITSEYKLGIYSAAASNYVIGDLYFLFAKE